jgi:hypothetical protein
VLRTADELQISTADATPRGVTNQFLARLWQLRRWALDALPGGGRYHIALMLLCIAAINPRLGMAFFCSVFLLAGYPALRFSERHAFHMEIIALFAAGFLLQGLVWIALGAWKHRRTFQWRHGLTVAKPVLLHGTAFTLLAVSLLGLPLLSARWWQSVQVSRLIAGYESANRTLLITQREERDGTTRYAIPGFGDPARHLDGRPNLPTYTEVLVLEFLPGPQAIPVNFTFEANHPNFQFDRTMTVPSAPPGTTGPTRMYYPVCYGPETRFTGFSLPASASGRLKGAFRLNDLGDEAILLNAVVPPNWKDLRKYQTLSR